MRELHHHTVNQVELYLRTALLVMGNLDLPADLREPCFAKAVDLLASKQVFFEPTDASPVAIPRMAIPRNSTGH